MAMGGLDIGPRPSIIPPEEEISGMKFQDMEVGLKISTALPCSILDKVFIAL